MARKIKFALEMADGVKVRNDIEELRKNFDLDSVVGHFLSGKLAEWLEDRYYDDEAEKIGALDKEAPNLHRQLCAILGVAYDSEEELDVEQLERLNEKKSILRQKTTDANILSHAAQTAFHQEDLADLLDMGEPTIYLCGETFNIPVRVGNKKYVGILGVPKIKINATSQAELDSKGIMFENVHLPWEKCEVQQKEVSTPIQGISNENTQHEKAVKNEAFYQQKAEEILDYLVAHVSYVDDDDFIAEDFIDFVKNDGNPEDIATDIMDFVQEENSRVDYDDDDVYEIARIIRKKDISTEQNSQPTTLNDKKADAIVEYLVEHVSYVDEGDFTRQDILEYLDDNSKAEDVATDIMDFVQEQNSRVDYDDDDVYEIARIVRKKRM